MDLFKIILFILFVVFMFLTIYFFFKASGNLISPSDPDSFDPNIGEYGLFLQVERFTEKGKFYRNCHFVCAILFFAVSFVLFWFAP
jgi:hypothetical protein